MQRLRTLLVATLTVLALAVCGAGHATAAARKSPPRVGMSSTELSYARSVLAMLNSQRVAHRLPKLRMKRSLTLASQRHNRSMAAANTISHQLPGERAFTERDRAAGWKPRCYGGENVGVNARMDRDGATQLQSLMYNERPPEDGHRLNILGTHYTHVGIAVLLDQRNGRLWLTTDFGQRRC